MTRVRYCSEDPMGGQLCHKFSQPANFSQISTIKCDSWICIFSSNFIKIEILGADPCAPHGSKF